MEKAVFVRNVQVLPILLLLFSVIPIHVCRSSVGIQSTAPHVFRLNVIFTGYTQTVVNTTLIDSNVQKSYSFTYGSHTMNYAFNVTYIFADSTYSDALKSQILANSVNGTNTTSKLNTTALQYQKSTGTKMSVFLPQSGRVADAMAVEDWLEANPYSGISEPCYFFYVMNFTEFDSADHALEHWYNVTEMDFETDNQRDWWRLEWDNALNPNVKFPYAAFTSQSRVFFIDPSAFQWYLTWARIWWGLSVSGPKYDYYYEDLDQFQATHDLSTTAGKNALAYYLAGWIEDPIRNLLAADLWTDTSIFSAKSLSVQALIINNASQYGYTNAAMDWIINTTLAELSIEDLAPFLNVNVQVNFVNMSDYPQLETIFDNSVVYQQNGWTYYDGYEAFEELYNVRDSYFNFSAADVVVNGYVLLECNMSMLAGSGEFTGLGGAGQILVMKAVRRYFKEDGTTPKSGLGMVFIHEAGHNLGFPHTFIQTVAHAGDFAFDVVGYYPYAYSFTQMRKDCFRRLVVDYRVLELESVLADDWLLYNTMPPTAEIDAKFTETYGEVNETKQLYDELRFLDAHSRLLEAENSEKELKQMILAYIAGAVFINADGSVQPPTAPISTADNVTYTLTGNINNSLVVGRDNIILNGALHTLQGTGSGKGLDLSHRQNVTVSSLEIRDFQYGIYLDGSSANSIYHCIFVNNTDQAHVNGLANVWDDGYPSGGNYWSNYAGADVCRGPGQNETNSDGVGDTPYIMDESNTDHYPLTKPYAGIHDLGVSASVSKTVVAHGYNITVTTDVKIVNYGTQQETFNFTFQVIGTFSSQMETLTGRNSTTLTFPWNATGFAKGYYAIQAYAEPVLGEIDIEDNTFTETVYIGVPGDVDGNHIVNMIDLYNVALHFGALRGHAGYVSNYDIDDNGVINMLDLYIAAMHYGQTDQ